MKKIFYVIIISIFVFSTSIPAFAATGPDFWVGNDSINVSDPLNWSGGSANEPPQSGDSLVFDAAGSAGANLMYDVASSTINGITFNSDADSFDIASSGSNTMTLTAPIANNSVNDETLEMIIAGAVSNTGTGLGSVILDGAIDSSVSAITENSSTSALAINGAINVNAGGTTLAITSGPSGDALFVDGGVTGVGNLILNNNASSGTNLEIDANPIDNTGTITNSGTGTDGTTIDAGVGANVTGITQDSATSALTIETNPITVNAGGTTLTDTAGTFTVTGGVDGTGNLTLENNSGTDDALSFSLNSINNAGTITNSGTSGETEISGGVGSSVTGITENSATSALVIDTNPIAVNAGGTTLTDTAGTLTVSGGVSGTGNLILNNNTATDNALSVTSNSINNTGTITNSGTGTGATGIYGGVGSNVTAIIENSLTSGLDLYVFPLTVNTGGTTLTVSSAPGAGALTVNSGVLGTGNLVLNNNTATDDALYLDTNSIDNTGTITNSGTGAGETLIAGGVGSNVTGIIEDSAASTLTIGTDDLVVNSSGTTLTATNGMLGVTSNVSGTGNLILNNNTATNGAITLSGTSVNNTGTITNSGTGTGSTNISAEIDSNVTDVIQNSATSALVLSDGSNAYTGATTITAGTLKTAAGSAIPDTSDVTVGSGGTLDLDGNTQIIGSLAGAGTVTTSVAGSTGFVDFDDSTTTFSGNIEDGSGQVEFIKSGNGTISLSGNSDYSGGTIIGSGAIRAESPNALGTGFVTNDATLSLGTTSLSVGGVYTQSAGSSLRLTIDSPSSFGSITTSFAAIVDPASAINVTVGGNIPNHTTFDIINTGGAGVGSAPLTVTSTSTRTSFTDSIVGNNLILTADTLASYSSLGNNPNARAIGAVLDNMTNPTTDMTNVINTLGGLSDAQATAALNTMGPVIDEGVMENSQASLNNMVSATLDRIQDSLDHATAISTAGTGLSSGDENALNGVWAKPYGSYLDQGSRDGIQGYDAWNAGTVIGYDRMITDTFTLGISGGYAYGQVDSDANDATVDITSAQGTIYAGYQDPILNYFIDAEGSFAWNWYDGKRDITVGSFNRTADSSYDGQQYGAYLDGGYRFNLGGNLENLVITPLASVQWDHLSFGSYTESNASALDLNVNKQDYDMLESGVGASVSYKMQYDWGSFIPEFHAKWLYDFINDDMQVTSSFTGGGGSFTTTGATPAKDGVDIGGKLSFNLNNNLSLIAAVDTELKDEFFGVYGSGTVRYKF